MHTRQQKQHWARRGCDREDRRSSWGTSGTGAAGSGEWRDKWDSRSWSSWGTSGTGAAGSDWGRTTESVDVDGQLAKFPRDSFTTSWDQVLQITVTSFGEGRHMRHRAKTRLPAMRPVRTHIVSDWFLKVDAAKAQVRQRAYDELQRLAGVAESSSDVLDCSGVVERSRQWEAHRPGSDGDMNDILRRSPQPAEVWIMRFDVQLEDCGETDTDKSFGLLVPPALADFALTLKIVGRGSGELSVAAHLAPFCMP